VPPKSKANRGPTAGPDNRRALVAAAREVFSQSGFMAPLSSVARKAGVGQGSLYRHFPDRIALAVAVFDDNIADLEALASQPDSTLDDLFDRVAEQAIGSTALIDMVTSNRHDPRSEHLGTRVIAVADAMLARDRTRGLVGAHVTTDDVMLSVSMLAFVLSRTDPDDRPAVAVRAHALFRAAFDGKSTRPAQ
jgi:AcrR family transcriptional regulator